MDTSELDLPAPYLFGVHLRDDFDFESNGTVGSAPPEEIAEEASESEPQSFAMMSDDEFLDSLVGSSDDQPIGNFGESEDGGGGAEADSLFSEQDDPSQISKPPRDSAISEQPPEVGPRKNRFPFSMPWVSSFDLEFKSAVTFLVGENGSGKSTLIEAIASMCGFPVCGGGKNDMASQFGPDRKSELAEAMYLHFGKRPRDGYFFRAEFYAQFASLLDQRALDPDFDGDPYRRYGGQSPHTRSHGESFLDFLNNRLGSGLFLMDEPESALSPQRQLSLMAIMTRWVKKKKTQFIVATHSPILMTFPGATILSLDSEAGTIEEVELCETSHFQLTQGILENPERYWQHLLGNSEPQ